MKNENRLSNIIKGAVKTLLIMAIVLIVLASAPRAASAEESFVEVIGNVYEFDKKSNYEITDAAEYVQSRHDNTYGKFSIQADFAGIQDEDGMMRAGVKGDVVGFYYSYGDGALYEDNKSGEWVLTKDTGKKIDGMKLDGKIGKGTILIQSSEDGAAWNTIVSQTDAFEETPYRAHPIYSASMQRYAAGSYFRVIVVYKEQKLIETKKILFFNIDKFDYRKMAEVYEFYLYPVEIDAAMVEDIEKQAASGAIILEEGANAADEPAPEDASAATQSGVSAWVWVIIGIVVVVIAAVVAAVIRKRKNQKE